MKMRTIAKQIDWWPVPFLGLGFGIWVIVDILTEPRVPPSVHLEPVTHAVVPPLASAQAFCFPELTEDAKVEAIERCVKERGEVSFSRRYVDCWDSEPYDEGSVIRWTYTVEEALRHDRVLEDELRGEVSE